MKKRIYQNYLFFEKFRVAKNEKQLVTIIENLTKMPDLNANDIDMAMNIIAGTARSMGVEVGS